MGFVRNKIRVGGELREAMIGDTPANPSVATAAATATLTTDQLKGGVILGTAAGASTLTLPTAAQVIAAFPEMNVGDCLRFCVTANGNTVSLAAGANITNIGAAGSLDTATGASRGYILRKDSATAMSLLNVA